MPTNIQMLEQEMRDRLIEKNKDIDRLRAELAGTQGELAGAMHIIKERGADNAAKDARIAAYLDENDRLRRERDANAVRAGNADARIAALQGGAERYWEGRWRDADARIAKLEGERACWMEQVEYSAKDAGKERDRAEKAEADCKRAEAERDAALELMRENTKLREALESLVYDAELQMKNPSHHMPFSLPKARAALNPSPAN